MEDLINEFFRIVDEAASARRREEEKNKREQAKAKKDKVKVQLQNIDELTNHIVNMKKQMEEEITSDYQEKIDALIEECNAMVNDYENVCLRLAEECDNKVSTMLDAYDKKLEELTNYKKELLKKIN